MTEPGSDTPPSEPSFITPRIWELLERAARPAPLPTFEELVDIRVELIELPSFCVHPDAYQQAHEQVAEAIALLEPLQETARQREGITDDPLAGAASVEERTYQLRDLIWPGKRKATLEELEEALAGLIALRACCEDWEQLSHIQGSLESLARILPRARGGFRPGKRMAQRYRPKKGQNG